MSTEPVDFAHSRALVTGASVGLGAVFATALARRGCALVLVARSRDRLEAHAATLRREHKVDVQVIAHDLGAPGAVQEVHAQATEGGKPVDILVNNAGFGTSGRFDTVPLARQLDEIHLNVAVLVAMTHTFLPAMRQRGRGAVVQLASTAAFQPVPYMATYGATKAFVLSFSEALWAENQGSGVRILAICPGATDTEFFRTMGSETGALGPKQKPEEVVELGLKSLDRDSCYVISGARNYVLAQSGRLMPRALVARASERIMRANAARKGY